MKHIITSIIILFTFNNCTVENENINVLDCIKTPIITDTVKICDQVWSTKNLDVDHYRNGDSIPEVTDSIVWANLTTGAWCFNQNIKNNGEIYGKIYNWYAVVDSRGLAPLGWHIATDFEWKELEICLGMTQTQADTLGWRGTNQGLKLKNSDDIYWLCTEDSANNSSHFNALPGGFRSSNGDFHGINADFGTWWSTDGTDSDPYYRVLSCVNAKVGRLKNYKTNGHSVRCIKDY